MLYIIYYFLLLLPLGVYWLPLFQTTYQEDFVLVGLFIYIFLRTFNLKRKTQPELFPFLVNFIFLSIVYAIGWYGLMRGYLNSWGQFTAIYLGYLAVLTLLPLPKTIPSPRIWILVQISVLSLLIIYYFFGFIIFFYDSQIPFSTKSVIPLGMGILVIALFLLLSPKTLPLQNTKAHIFPLLAAVICFFPVWKENIITYIHWYSAGELERAWTPYKYYTEEEIQAAERKPLEAIHEYLIVLERIQHKGDIPFLLDWPFYMKFRMATQAQRLGNAPACAAYVSPAYEQDPYKMSLIRDLWDVELLNDAIHFPPKYSEDQTVWVDFEITDTGQIFAADRWGRVFEKMQGVFVPRDDNHFNKINAIDLEVVKGEHIVMFSDGEFLVDEEKLIFDHFVDHNAGQRWIDFEYLPSHQAFVICSEFGEIVLLQDEHSTVSEDFPQFHVPIFDQAVVADLEIDPNQQGFYVLDHFGAVHAFNSNEPSLPYKKPDIPEMLLPYWGEPMVIDLAIDTQNNALYVYNQLGELFSITPTPFIETYRPERTWPQRGVSVETSPDGSVIIFESNGNHHIVYEPPNPQ